MSTDKKDSNADMLKNEDVNNTQNKGNQVPNINPTPESRDTFTNEEIEEGLAGGAPSQKSGSRGSADVQDGGQDVGSSAGSH